MDFILTIVVDLPSLRVANATSGSVLFCLLILLQVVYILIAVVCALKDPTDPTIYYEQYRKKHK
jgi:hypothetical protein